MRKQVVSEIVRGLGEPDAKRTVRKVLVASLRPQDEQAADGDVGEDSDSRERPDEGIADEVNLAVVLDPAAERRTRKPAVRSDEEQPAYKLMPRRRSGQLCGLESYAWRSVKPWFVCHITA